MFIVGDKIKKGVYRLHSEYKNVVNYVDDRGNLVMLANNKTGPGPRSIVLNTLKDIGNTLEFSSNVIRTGSICEQYDKHLVYDSALPFDVDNCGDFVKNLPHLEKTLIDAAAEKSLTFLIDSKRKSAFKSGFEKQFVNRITAGVQMLLDGSIKDGILLVSGTGFGLTPSGDDFIAGMLTALNLLNKSSVRIVKMLKVSRLTNALTKNFLEMAAQGRVCAKFKDILVSMRDGDAAGMKKAVRKYCAIGETSGADFLTGFLMTVKNGAAGLNVGQNSNQVLMNPSPCPLPQRERGGVRVKLPKNLSSCVLCQ